LSTIHRPLGIAGVVFDEAAIAEAVDRLAGEIARDLGGEPVMLVGVLKGALFFTADLSRALPHDMDD